MSVNSRADFLRVPADELDSPPCWLRRSGRVGVGTAGRIKTLHFQPPSYSPGRLFVSPQASSEFDLSWWKCASSHAKTCLCSELSLNETSNLFLRLASNMHTLKKALFLPAKRFQARREEKFSASAKQKNSESEVGCLCFWSYALIFFPLFSSDSSLAFL